MSKFTTPNGKASISVPDSQDKEMKARGMVLKQPKDATATTKPKKSDKPISKVKEGESRTR